MKNICLSSIILLFMLIFMGGGTSLKADVPNEIRYNGKIKEYNKEVDGKRNLKFSIFGTLTGGTAKWTSEPLTVNISSGIFSCILQPQYNNFNWYDKDLYIEVSVDGTELSPREKLTAVPYSLHSATAENISVKSNTEINLKIANNNRLTVSDTDVKFKSSNNKEFYMVPKYGIIIWSGAADNIPDGWVLCDGNNGTPDLRDRFVLGAGGAYSVNSTGGEKEHILTIDEMPNHTHAYTSPIAGGSGGMQNGNHYGSEAYMNPAVNGGISADSGKSKSHNNMPPYYSLCYIMRQ